MTSTPVILNPPPPRLIQPRAIHQPSHKLGVFFACALAMTVVARLPEIGLMLVGSGLLLAPLAYLGAGVFSVAGGGWRVMYRSPISALMVGFAAWYLACIPFSAWPGGSFFIAKEVFIKAILCYFLLNALIQTATDCRKVMLALGACTPILLAMTHLFGQMTVGRFELSAGTFKNSNMLAFYLLFTSSFLLLYALSQRGFTVKGLVTSIIIVGAIVTAMKTASRAALLTLVLVGLYSFWQASMSTKIKLVPALLLLAVTFYLFLPAPVVQRYATLLHFGGEEEVVTSQTSEAVESAETRKRLFWQSVRFTIEHPIFGVGPGSFSIAADEESRAIGRRSDWLQTHNSYTQISSEMGFPGLFCFAGTLFYCLFKIYALYRATRFDPELQQIHHMAYCLLLALVEFAVSAIFMSVGYQEQLPILAGLSAALLRIARQEQRALAIRRSNKKNQPARPLAPPFCPLVPNFVGGR